MITASLKRWRRLKEVSPFGGNILLTVLANVGIAGLSLVTGVLAARLLGPEGRGELVAIQTWPLFLATVATLGLPDATVYYSAREPNRAGQFMTSSILVLLVASVPFGMVGYFLMPHLLAAQNAETVVFARRFLWVIPVLAVMGMSYHPLRGRNDLSAWNVLRTSPTAGWLVLLLIAWYLGIASAGWLAMGYLVVLLALAVPAHAVVRLRVPGSFRPDVHAVKPMLRYGLSSIAGSIPQVLNVRLDQMVMVGVLAPQMLGLYVVAVSWSAALSPVVAAVGSVLFPRVASQAGVGAQLDALAQGTRLGAVASVAVALAVMALTPWALPALFGADFAPAIPAGLVLVAAGAVAGINGILQEGARGLGHPIVILWSESAGVAVGLCTLLLLLNPLGILGAAVASVIGYATTTAALVLQIGRLTGCRTGDLLWAKNEDWLVIRGRLADLRDSRKI